MLFKFSGQRPTTLGVKKGKLTECPDSPNCVSSQASTEDKVHYVAPIELNGTKSGQAIAKLKELVGSLPRTEIVESSSNYLYAEFTTALMGYVDDVEFLVDGRAKVVHVRSASRLGRSDLGVNRKRVETVRRLFSQPA